MEGECACRRVAGHRLCALNALFLRPVKQDLSGTTLKVSRLVWGERAERRLGMLRNAPNRFFRGGQATRLRIPSTWRNHDRYGPTRLSRFLREHLFPKKTNLISPPVITASQGAITPLAQGQRPMAGGADGWRTSRQGGGWAPGLPRKGAQHVERNRDGGLGGGKSLPARAMWGRERGGGAPMSWRKGGVCAGVGHGGGC